VTVLVYLPYYHGPSRYYSSSVWHFLEAPLRCHFCLVVFNFLSHDFTLILISLSLCIYQLHHSSTSFHFINYSVLHFDHLNDRHSFSQSPSSNCVHYKVYFILHFIIYFYLYSFFIIYVLMTWLNPLPVSVYFLVLPHFPNIQSPSFSPSIPSVLVCLHSLSFFPRRTHLLLVLPCRIVPFNPIQSVCLRTT